MSRGGGGDILRLMSRTSVLLMQMYEAMRSRFGDQGWWPTTTGQDRANPALEICVGAILTQNTNWSNVEKALGNLISAGCMSITGLQGIGREDLAELIRPAGYFNVKARRLKNFIARVWDGFGDDIGAFLDRPVGALRRELLSIKGIGPETADSMILYAAGECCFVVDAYTYRILLRHLLICPEDDYEAIKQLMESSLPEDADLWADYHAQLVAVGKSFCRPTARCGTCPLESFDHDTSVAL